MSKVEAHANGNFCWIELGTTSQEGAKTFYGELFGWQAKDVPMGPGEVYTIFESDGQSSGAAYRSGDEVEWKLYIAVADADAAAAKVEPLGGKLLKAPFDVFDTGRMAEIEDPTGATFCIWQAGRNKGLSVVGENNAFCWADLSTPDPARAKDFYTGLFDWTISQDERDPSGYLHIQNGAQAIGGVQGAEQRNRQTPPHWLIYFQTADCEASAAKAQELGARVHLAPVGVAHVGRFAVLADSAGAMFALYEPTHAA